MLRLRYLHRAYAAKLNSLGDVLFNQQLEGIFMEIIGLLGILLLIGLIAAKKEECTCSICMRGMHCYRKST